MLSDFFSTPSLCSYPFPPSTFAVAFPPLSSSSSFSCFPDLWLRREDPFREFRCPPRRPRQRRMYTPPSESDSEQERKEWWNQRLQLERLLRQLQWEGQQPRKPTPAQQSEDHPPTPESETDEEDNEEEVEEGEIPVLHHPAIPKHEPRKEATLQGGNPCQREQPPPRVPSPLTQQDQDHPAVEATVGIGLENPAGEQNCFLNVVLQCLWHLPQFRAGVEQLVYHKCTGSTCVFCALKCLFRQFQPNQRPYVLTPREVRAVVSAAFAASRKFQLQQQEDAAEFLVDLLHYLHQQLSLTPTTTTTTMAATTAAAAAATDICNPACLVHQLFASEIIERSEACQVCHQAGHYIFPYTTLVHYFPAVLLAKSSAMGRRIEDVAREHNESEVRTCDFCQTTFQVTRKLPVRKYLCKAPAVFTWVLAWPNEGMGDDVHTPLYAQILTSLPVTLDVAKMFHTTSNSSSNAFLPAYTLTGLICFFGRHYVAYWFQASVSQWVGYDDTHVRAVGSWRQVLHALFASRQMPSVLFYTKSA